MADDMWLKVQELIADVKVVNGRYYAHPVTIPTSQKIALQKENDAQDSRSNKYLRLMNEYYNKKSILKYLKDVSEVCMQNCEFESYDNLTGIIREIATDDTKKNFIMIR